MDKWRKKQLTQQFEVYTQSKGKVQPVVEYVPEPLVKSVYGAGIKPNNLGVGTIRILKRGNYV